MPSYRLLRGSHGQKQGINSEDLMGRDWLPHKIYEVGDTFWTPLNLVTKFGPAATSKFELVASTYSYGTDDAGLSDPRTDLVGLAERLGIDISSVLPDPNGTMGGADRQTVADFIAAAVDA